MILTSHKDFSSSPTKQLGYGTHDKPSLYKVRDKDLLATILGRSQSQRPPLSSKARKACRLSFIKK